MRIQLLCLVLVASACTRHNPASCCSTQQQCDSFGLKQITGCASGQVCDSTGTCQMDQCSTSADCTSSSDPVCIDHLCVAACGSDGDCMGLSGRPYCASDGACVACTDSSQCTADAPVCDMTSHSCRTCKVDAECPSGVCEEVTGTCAAANDIVYLSMNGSDAGDCTSAAPCLTFGYGLGKASGSRNVIRLQGGYYEVGSSTAAITGKTLVVDADSTHVTQSGSAAPVFSVSGGAVVTFEGMDFATTANVHAISVAAGGDVTAYGIELDDSTVGVSQADPIAVDGGRLAVIASKFTYGGGSTGQGTREVISCGNGGELTVSQSTLQNCELNSQGCTLTVQRNVIDNQGDGSVNASQGLIVVENNLIEDAYELADSMSVGSATTPGSTVRFNTFVNTSGVTSSATYLSCDGTVDVTSNIFAWNSTNPPMTCNTTHSLFDSHVQQAGEGNQSADVSTFFADMAHGDFHLAAGSPAKGAGEPGLVTEDLDGNPRPQPAGSNPDVGAYEAP